jgi:hypothetical protein
LLGSIVTHRMYLEWLEIAWAVHHGHKPSLQEIDT